MAEEMTIENYLAAGGVLTNPTNVPPRYRAELMKLMATFVDSELAGAAGFADVINAGSGIKERIAAAKIVLEKTDNADKVLRIMGDFGADADRYANNHPWTARLDRDADIGSSRSDHDMRLAVFNYPLQGWVDSVAMNLLMSRAVVIQLTEFSMISYQPLAEAFRTITPIETRHAELAAEGTIKLIEEGQADALQVSIDYWWPRVAASFGSTSSTKAETLKGMGLRKSTNAELKTRWQAEATTLLESLGLKRP
ncbi:phenylacetic acid catabolic [Phaeobacter gallaeciensis]|uniref:Phenylacetic acid catabolic n=2 Tax=Roseobacteraceae TaxID=2854170 RepID=A0A366WNQ9_9RHOB|nr:MULTISPECIES: Phenylacetic acid catabolic protein [Roseobacteraceae]MBT3141634.1 phenylacetate-CoA oxygenase subunit PaaI [Falsiruegeria litorea]MBT8170189.1 phenylacetate-CoA oxygenase subunit PaaI [Falsiruegeria litorea]RBW50807.1 phenylacetic acid catabolic [Phaeobacter gallaeciensis]